MFGLGIQELIVIIIVVLLLIDHRRLPEFTRGIGKIYRDLKSAQDSIKNELIKEDIISVVDDNSAIQQESKETQRALIDERTKDSGPGRAG